MKKFGAALAVVALLATSGCGGGGRPSTEEISKSLIKNTKSGELKDIGVNIEFTKKQADCVAKAFHDSKLSDKALKAIVEADKGYKETKKDTEALKATTPALTKCMVP